jgi:hypothetical protein
MILPYIDKSALFNAINFQTAPTNIQSLAVPGINDTAGRISISTFLCPSDPAPILQPYGPTSYRANLGGCGSCGNLNEQLDGAFNRRGTRPSDFIDGMSNTISLSEKLIGGAPLGRYMPARDWILSWPSDDPIALSANNWREFCAGLSLSDSLPSVRFDGGRSWMLGLIEYTGFSTAVAPNSEIADCGNEANDGVGVFAARSFHPGVVHAAMADSSVRTVSNRVDREVWRAIGTRGKGELVSADSY